MRRYAPSCFLITCEYRIPGHEGGTIIDDISSQPLPSEAEAGAAHEFFSSEAGVSPLVGLD